MSSEKPRRIRVIDLTMHLSGPYCCWLLSTLGAEVIKVERTDGGDPVRETGPFVVDQSTYFGSVNRNKRSIALDLKSPQGKLAFAELLKTADVLVENFRAGVLARLGFDETRIKELNPNLILASITGFGQAGEWARRPAFDIVVQGMSGMMSVTGQPGGRPTAVGASIADLSAGVFCALAVQSALLQRERTGEARRVDISMLDCQLALLENAAARYLNTGEHPVPTGSRHPRYTPFQAYETADKPVVIAADGQKNWEAFCRTVGLESLITDPRFENNEVRVEHYDELEGIISAEIRKWKSADLLKAMAEADVPCGPINSVPDILESNYVKERGSISTVTRGGLVMRYVASPVSPRPFQESAAPQLGEHTDEILEELGLKSREPTDA